MQRGEDAQRGHAESGAGWKSEAAGSLGKKAYRRRHAISSGKTEQIHREKRAPGETEPPTSRTDLRHSRAPGAGQATGTLSANTVLLGT